MATRHSSLSIGWLATVISVLSACTPSDSVPLSGSVSLEYVGTSHSDGAVDFALANGSSRSIYFRGNPEPRGATMSCIRPEDAEGFMQAIADPPATEETVKVSPGRRLRTSLFVIRLPPDFKNGHRRCRLRLTLENGTVVESPEFTPH
jgi:hypothetical protein